VNYSSENVLLIRAADIILAADKDHSCRIWWLSAETGFLYWRKAMEF